MSTTPASMQTATRKRDRRARTRPLRATQTAPGMYEVERLGTDGDHTHTVDLRENACTCRDYEMRMGPAGGDCYHLRFLKLVAAGVLCPRCGYEYCRPSCPARSTDSEDSDR